MRHYNDRYVVNELGELFSLCRGGMKKLKPYINNRGYVMYRLRVDGKTIQRLAHHLSYWVNVGHFDTSDGLQIDHIDGNKLNNHYTNLRRVTPKDNANNINTMGELKSRSRSGYRLGDTDKLPEVFSKESLYVAPISVTSNNTTYNKRYLPNRCTSCEEPSKGSMCLSCFEKHKSAHIPSKEVLIEDLLTKESLVRLASKYGISDNAYRKWLAKRGLPTKYREIKSFLMSV